MAQYLSSAPSPRYRRYVLGLLLGAYVLSYLDRQILYILIEPIKLELALSDTQIGLLGGLTFALFYATLGMPIAWLADKYSRKNIMVASLVIWSGMTAASGAAVNFGQLLLARIGVAVGEAGCNPSAHSLIADLYPPEKRATALSTYQLGIPIGVMIGLFAGGWISQFFGWRAAFFAVGIPGLLFSLIVMFTLKEPVRGLSEPHRSRREADDMPSFKETIRHLWSLPSFRHIAMGTSLVGFVMYHFFMWTPSFLIRSYEMSSGQAGTILALVNGLGGGLGTYLGGYLADRVGATNAKRYLIVPGIATMLAFPFSLAIFLNFDVRYSVFFMGFPVFLGLINSGATYSLTQRLAHIRMRALAASILLFLINIVGLGIGPQVVGWLSDILRPSFGEESLRYALAIGSAGYLWAGIHYLLGSRHIQHDLARVEGSAKTLPDDQSVGSKVPT